MFMCMCGCVYAHVCVCVYMCVPACVCACTLHMCLCMCVHACVCMCVGVCCVASSKIVKMCVFTLIVCALSQVFMRQKAIYHLQLPKILVCSCRLKSTEVRYFTDCSFSPQVRCTFLDCIPVYYLSRFHSQSLYISFSVPPLFSDGALM